MKKILSLSLAVVMIISVLFSVPFTANATDVPDEPENGIPLIVVNIDESDEAIANANTSDSSHQYGTIDDMNGSIDHSVRCVGDVNISVPAGFVSEYGSSSVPAGNIKLKYIRGRGNTTWSNNKKPYKIEFKNAVDLFGMGESTDWALMANAIDKSKLKNRITSQLGNNMGMPYCTQSIPVEVVMTGSKTGSKYLGLYYLSETVKVEQSRVNIPKLKKSVTDEESITGGYLLSLYTDFQNSDEPASNHFKVNSGLEFITKTPEFTSEDLTDGQRAQRTYIQNYISELDELIMNHDEIDAETHAAIAEKLNLNSVADYWWIQEFSKNSDAFETSSTYFYKDRNGKLCFGPLWDFDIAWEYYGFDDESSVKGFANTEMNWIDELRGKDPLFAEILKERWNNPVDGMNLKLAELTKDGGLIDTDCAEIKSAWEIDNELWQTPIYDENGDEEEYTKNYTLAEHANMLKSWINSRRAWVNTNIESVDKLFHTVTFKVDGEVIKTEKVKDKSMVSDAPILPERDGYVFNGWLVEGSSTYLSDISIEEDTTVVANYVKETEQTLPRAIYLEYKEHWQEISKDENFYFSMTIMPNTAIGGNIKYTSSDESVAIYSQEDGCYKIKGTGDTTLSVTARNGVSASMILHIYDETITPGVEVTEIKATVPKKLEPGAYAQIETDLLPAGQPLKTDNVFFSTPDNDIVELEMSTGVIKALKPGKATISATIYPDDYDLPEITQSFEVVVEHTLDNGKVTKAPSYTSTGIKSYTCTLCGETIKTEVIPKKALAKVKTVKCKARTASAEKLIWSAVTGAEGYQIQISNAAGTKWGKVYNAKANKAYLFKKLASGSNYKFRVRAYTKGTDGKHNYGAWTKAVASPTLPAGTALTKLTAAKKAFSAKWKAGKKVSGYQIQYSQNAKFTGAKIKTVKNPKKLTASVNKLGSKKVYYVRVRTYKTISKVNYFSAWSKTYKVKTK